MKRKKLFQLAVSFLCLFVLPNITEAQDSLRVPRPSSDSEAAPAKTGSPTGAQTAAQSAEQIGAHTAAQIGAHTEAQAGAHGNVLNGSVSKVSSGSPVPFGSTVSPGSAAESGTSQQQSSALSNQGAVSNPLKANARVDDVGAPFRSTLAISEWEQRNLHPQVQMQNETATMGHEHHGLKHHLASAFTLLGSAVGSTVVAVATSQSYYARAAVNQAERNKPTISVDAGHCPAMFDPAFQVPVRWWDVLAREQGSPTLGPQWKFWLSAVQNVFNARASELHQTPGTAAIHVIVNPDGSIFNITPYTGNERRNANAPPSEGTLLNMRQIIFEVGKFPPFPEGTKVQCYHLIFDGSYGG